MEQKSSNNYNNHNNNNNHNHNPEGHNGNKRSFSEMSNGTPSPSPSFLQQLYHQSNPYNPYTRNNRSNRNGNSKTNIHINDEQIMSSLDFSLQSFGDYKQLFTQTNKTSVSCISISEDGLYSCVGCQDGTIRIYDVNKLHQSGDFSSLIKKYENSSDLGDVHRPLITTLNPPYLTHHSLQQTVNELDFHPQLTTTKQLASCNGKAIHFYEFGKKNHRKSPISTIDECFVIKTAQYHPCGEYVIAAGESCYVRLYDIKKEQGYIGRKTDNNDYNINQVRWSLNGNFFVACTNSGDIRLYDGRSMEIVNRMNKMHNGLCITSLRLSSNDKYLLSAGYDDIIRLSDLRVGKQCMEYKGCKNNKPHNIQCNFTYNDEHIIAYSNINKRIYIYDTNTGQKIKSFKDNITYLATSTTEPAFMCASTLNNKTRFYATIKQLSSADDNDDDSMRGGYRNNHNQNFMINGHSNNNKQ